MENKQSIYLNMCHHYRKIFNAKSCVDTSPPKVFQKKKTYSKYQGISASQMKTVNKSNSDAAKRITAKKNESPAICPYYYQHHLKDKKLNSMDNKPFLVSNKPFIPTILKSDVQSRLRNLHVYHPPRKRQTAIKNDDPELPQMVEKNKNKKENLDDRPCSSHKKGTKNVNVTSLVTSNNGYSEESSEDSAYNEGECILSSDSRGSTPQIFSMKHQLPAKRNLGLRITANKFNRKVNSALLTTDDNDILYIQFLKEITSDILKKNIFTNKALRTVIQQHIALNEHKLNPDKMLKEITKLQERLGVPTDEQLDDENYGLGKDLPESEILEEKEETANETTVRLIESEENELKITSKKEKDESFHEKAASEENYSDSFSDISQSDSDNEKNSGTETDNEEATSNATVKSNENSNSDEGVNYCKSGNNSSIDSDLDVLDES